MERSMMATRCGSSSSSAGCGPGALRSATSHSCSPSSSRFSSSGCRFQHCYHSTKNPCAPAWKHRYGQQQIQPQLGSSQKVLTREQQPER